jgi:hypothetical protein
MRCLGKERNTLISRRLDSSQSKQWCESILDFFGKKVVMIESNCCDKNAIVATADTDDMTVNTNGSMDTGDDGDYDKNSD